VRAGARLSEDGRVVVGEGVGVERKRERADDGGAAGERRVRPEAVRRDERGVGDAEAERCAPRVHADRAKDDEAQLEAARDPAALHTPNHEVVEVRGAALRRALRGPAERGGARLRGALEEELHADSELGAVARVKVRLGLAREVREQHRDGRNRRRAAHVAEQRPDVRVVCVVVEPREVTCRRNVEGVVGGVGESRGARSLGAHRGRP